MEQPVRRGSSRGAMAHEEGMDTEIGTAAGVIWRYLAAYGETTLRDLKPGTQLSEPLLLMGLGWLAREEKLRFVQERRTLKIALYDQREA